MEQKFIDPDARFLYAGFAMIGLLANGSITMPSLIAKKAVDYADALIEHLMKEDDELEERIAN